MKTGDKIIDVSEHRELIDWKKVLSTDVRGVIIRCGYGRNSEDKYFEKNVAGCIKYNIPIIGVYHFMYALNNQHARTNAENAIGLVKKAGLPDTTTIWADVEYDTIKYANGQGVSLGKNEVDLFTRTFCETIKAAGYKTGIYLNNDYRKNYYCPETLAKYDLWLADYTGGPDVQCLIQQTGKEVIPGIPGVTDVNIYFGAKTSASSEATNYKNKTYLQKGDKGLEVKKMQEMLICIGYSCGKSGADSDFGTNTDLALRAFQDDYKLTVDGKYGIKSKEALLAAYEVIKIYKKRVSA